MKGIYTYIAPIVIIKVFFFNQRIKSSAINTTVSIVENQYSTAYHGKLHKEKQDKRTQIKHQLTKP